VASYVARLAPGSYVVLSVGRADGEAAKQGFGAYSSGGTRVYNHSVQDFASFFGPSASPACEAGYGCSSGGVACSTSSTVSVRSIQV